jgi:RND family efflux transporter MFP subunit
MVVLSLALAACSGDGKKAEAAPSRQAVTAAVVTASVLPRAVTASGSVSAWEEVPVGAETGGLVATGVYVDEGAYVRRGQPLVQLNDALLRAQLGQQQAAVAAAEANVARDDAALARARELRERGFLSQASLDTALANQRASAANLAAARASLSEVRTRVNQATIRAPVAGMVASRNVTRGQIVQPGTELFRLVRDGRLELDAQIPEAELPLVRAGMTAVITSEQAGRTTGTVRIVTPEVNPQSRLGVARISLSGGGLRPGMFARADFQRMADKLQGIAGRFLLSINDRPEIREMFAWADIEAVKTTYSIQGGNAPGAAELLIGKGVDLAPAAAQAGLF